MTEQQAIEFARKIQKRKGELEETEEPIPNEEVDEEDNESKDDSEEQQEEHDSKEFSKDEETES